MLTKVVLFCVVVTVAHCWESSGYPEAKPDKFKNVQGCYISELDSMVPLGQSTPSKEMCKKYVCYGDIVKHVGCGSVSAVAPCKVVEHTEKPFPGCCPTISCS